MSFYVLCALQVCVYAPSQISQSSVGSKKEKQKAHEIWEKIYVRRKSQR